jgi:hypothetical protein
MCPIHGGKDQTHITIQPGHALLMTYKRKDHRISSCMVAKGKTDLKRFAPLVTEIQVWRATCPPDRVQDHAASPRARASRPRL